MRNFNPTIRRFTKTALQVPLLKELPECSWPESPENCTLGSRRKLVAEIPKPDRYEVRSIETEYRAKEEIQKESDECAIGPEYHGLFRNEQDIRTVAEALVDVEINIGNLSSEQRLSALEDIEKTIKGDIGRRSTILMTYAVYFVVAGIVLIYNYQNSNVASGIPFLEDKVLQLVFGLVPLIFTFYLHNLYGERVRSGTIIHLLPISILATLIIYLRCLQDGFVSNGHRMVLMATSLISLALVFYLIFKLRTTYEMCSKHQLNRKLDSSQLVLIAIFGIMIPLIIQFLTYTSVTGTPE